MRIIYDFILYSYNHEWRIVHAVMPFTHDRRGGARRTDGPPARAVRRGRRGPSVAARTSRRGTITIDPRRDWVA